MSDTWLALGIVGGIFLIICFCVELDVRVSRYMQKSHDAAKASDREQRQGGGRRPEGENLMDPTEKQAAPYQKVNNAHNGFSV